MGPRAELPRPSGRRDAARPRRRTWLQLAALVALGACRSEPPRAVPTPLGLPFDARAPVELVAAYAPAVPGAAPSPTRQRMWRGSVWREAGSAGFGLHEARAALRIGDGKFTLVRADSGLWFIETATLARRARLRTGEVTAVDVSADGSLFAYAECPAAPIGAARTCTLVVRQFPSLDELKRAPISNAIGLRFGSAAAAVAVSRGHYGGPVVVPLAANDVPWEAPSGSESWGALPLRAQRVAALTSGGGIVIFDRGRGEVFYARAPRPARTRVPALLDLLTWGHDPLGLDDDAGPLFYDAAGDRVLRVVASDEVRVIERASGDAPAGLTTVSPSTLGAVDALRDLGRASALYGRGLALRDGERITGHSPDFAEGEGWEASASGYDVVYWHRTSERTLLRRVSLERAALDAIAAPAGDLARGTDHRPLVFTSGARAFLLATPGGQLGLVWLPRGGSPGPTVWTNCPAPPFHEQPTGDGTRYTYVAPDKTAVEIDEAGARAVPAPHAR